MKIRAINIGYLERHIGKYLSQNLIAKESNIYSVDLEKIGFNKLLGDGRVSMKFKIKVHYASKTAVEKVKEAGGQVIV